jgi:hypothetical protein
VYLNLFCETLLQAGGELSRIPLLNLLKGFFSGRPNPTIELGGVEAEETLERLEARATPQ